MVRCDHQARSSIVTGLPIALFNGCVVVEPTAEAELDAALVWLNRRGVPYLVSIAEPLAPQLSEVVQAHGLVGPEPYPGMVLHPVPAAPDPAPGVTVVAGPEPGQLDFLPRSFGLDPDVRVFSARLDGRPSPRNVQACGFRALWSGFARR